MLRVLGWLGVCTGVPSLTVWASSQELDQFILIFAFAVVAMAFGVFSYVLAAESGKHPVRPGGK